MEFQSTLPAQQPAEVAQLALEHQQALAAADQAAARVAELKPSVELYDEARRAAAPNAQPAARYQTLRGALRSWVLSTAVA